MVATHPFVFVHLCATDSPGDKSKQRREANCDDLHVCYFYMYSDHLYKYDGCTAGHSLIT